MSKKPSKKTSADKGIINKWERKEWGLVAKIIGEKQRTYHYAGGEMFTVDNVVEVVVSRSGNHRLKSANGRLWVVMAGWIAIEITAKDWSV